MADLITMLSAVAGQQGGEEADPNFNQTVLLLHGDGTNGAQNNTFLDGSTNNFTITRNGNTTQGTFSPFSLAAGEWSNYFDGSGDDLRFANNAALNLESGDFTVECWFYTINTSANRPIIFRFDGDAGSRNDLQFAFNIISGNLIIAPYSGTTNYDMSFSSVPLNQWNHCALVRTGNNFYAYLNGVRNATTQTISGNLNNGTWETWIGGYREGGVFAYQLGYISNVRILKGTALYTGATYTIPTAPLTAITNTSLLTCQSNRFVDNSTNAFAITRNGDVRVTPFSPFAPSAAYSAGTNGGSGYFDGSGDYLTIADNTALDMEASDFTIECWFYPVVTPNQSICSKRASSSDFAGVNIYFSNSTTPKALASVNGTTWEVDMTSSININVGEWSHLALTRSSNTWTLWVNGVSGATATVSGTVPNNAGAFAVGSAAADGLFNLSQSHIASFRVVKGTALYSTTFTPPTSPLTAVANTSLLLNFTNAGIIDNTTKNNLETVGNAQIDTAVKKYGTGSVELDGDDYLVIRDDENLEFGAGDFTIEAFVRFAALPANNTSAGVITKWNASNLSYFAGAFNNAGTMQVAFFYSTNGSAQTNILANQTFSTGVWYHLAYVRNGSSFKIFVDGTEKTSSATISGTLFNGTQAVNIGRSGDGFNYLNGFIDELRVTKGVARYTANFTAPTKAFPDQ